MWFRILPSEVDKKSPYLTTLEYKLGSYRYTGLSFSMALACDMFQHKIDEILKKLPNVFGIADDILIVGYNAESGPLQSTDMIHADMP